jgi:hypothetical protein
MIGASSVICGERLAFARQADVARLGGQDRILQHRLVQLEAHFLDVARLLVAQQVARAAQVEVVAGELEAGAERSRSPSTFSRFSATSDSACPRDK